MRRERFEMILYRLLLVLIPAGLIGCGGPSGDVPEEAASAQPAEQPHGDSSGAEPADVEGKTLLEVAQESGELTQFLMAVERTELAETLAGEGPFTIFAPGDDAFDLLPPELLDQLFEPQQQRYLTRLLSNHIVEGELRTTDRRGEGMQHVETLAGETVAYLSEDFGFYFETAEVDLADLEASNGVLHRIDRIVILPQN